MDDLPSVLHLLRPRDVLYASFVNTSLGCAIGV